MDRKLVILFCPMNALGHLNPFIGFGQFLVPKHRVVFAVGQELKGQLIKYGFEEEVYDNELSDTLSKNEENFKNFSQQGIFQNKPLMEKMKEIVREDYLIRNAQRINPKIKDIVDKINPDLVIVDSTMILPAAIKDHLWINLIPSNPNALLFDERAPPFGLGN